MYTKLNWARRSNFGPRVWTQNDYLIGFLAEGGAFSKKNSKFRRHFFSSTKSIFWPAGKFWKTGQKQVFLAFFWTFWTLLTVRAGHKNLAYTSAEGAIRKNLGSVSKKKWRSQNCTKVSLWHCRIWIPERGRPPSFNLLVALFLMQISSIIFNLRTSVSTRVELVEILSDRSRPNTDFFQTKYAHLILVW